MAANNLSGGRLPSPWITSCHRQPGSYGPPPQRMLAFFHAALLLRSSGKQRKISKTNLYASAGQQTQLRWQWAQLVELQPIEQYAMHRLRQEVFVVEQQCVYLDADGCDRDAYHLLGWSPEGRECGEAGQETTTGDVLVAYLRAMRDPERGVIKLGRIVTDPRYRGRGHGREVLEKVLQIVGTHFGDCELQLHAQCYATGFYHKFGFEVRGDEFDEDGIPHIEMVRVARRAEGERLNSK